MMKYVSSKCKIIYWVVRITLFIDSVKLKITQSHLSNHELARVKVSLCHNVFNFNCNDTRRSDKCTPHLSSEPLRELEAGPMSTSHLRSLIYTLIETP